MHQRAQCEIDCDLPEKESKRGDTYLQLRNGSIRKQAHRVANTESMIDIRGQGPPAFDHGRSLAERRVLTSRARTSAIEHKPRRSDSVLVSCVRVACVQLHKWVRRMCKIEDIQEHVCHLVLRVDHCCSACTVPVSSPKNPGKIFSMAA